LWIKWENRGSLQVQAQSDLAMIDSNKFQKVATHHRSTFPLLKQYAALFAHAVAEAATSNMVDDIFGTNYKHLWPFLEDSDSLEDILDADDAIAVASASCGIVSGPEQFQQYPDTSMGFADSDDAVINEAEMCVSFSDAPIREVTFSPSGLPEQTPRDENEKLGINAQVVPAATKPQSWI